MSWVVSASDPNVSAESESEIAAATEATVTLAGAIADPDVAVIVDVPSATAVTRPADDTVATSVSDEDHVTVGLAIVLSFASFTVGVKVAVSAKDAKVRVVGDRVTDTAA